MNKKDILEKNQFFYMMIKNNPHKKTIRFEICSSCEDWNSGDIIVASILNLIVFSEEEKGIEIWFSPIIFPLKKGNRSYFKMNVTPDGNAFIIADSFDSVDVTICYLE